MGALLALPDLHTMAPPDDDDIDISEEPAPPPPPRMADRRKTPRHALKLGVRFSHETDFARSYRAYTENIGLAGVCLLTKSEYEVGQPLQLEIDAAGTPLRVEGVVAWVKPGTAIGVRFEKVSGEQRAVLAQLLASAPPLND